MTVSRPAGKAAPPSPHITAEFRRAARTAAAAKEKALDAKASLKKAKKAWKVARKAAKAARRKLARLQEQLALSMTEPPAARKKPGGSKARSPRQREQVHIPSRKSRA